MSVVFVALGSNLGDRAEHLRFALQAMDALPQTRMVGYSRFRRTEPVGGPAQRDFVNAVARCETCLSPNGLLQDLLRIEARRGRRRLVEDGPRTLDLDLLLYGDHVSEEESLKLPHPRMAQRRFVMEPLAELAPRLTLADGRTTRQCLASLA